MEMMGFGRSANCALWSPSALTVHRTVIHYRLCSNPQCSYGYFHFPLSLWWRWWDSNPWPPACRAGALPAELHPHLKWFCAFLYLLFLTLGKRISPLSSVNVSTELSSRTVSRKVFSPLQSLTSVFGMGTGGPSAFVALTILNNLSVTENWTTIVSTSL